jgi:hypothetical protein
VWLVWQKGCGLNCGWRREHKWGASMHGFFKGRGGAPFGLVFNYHLDVGVGFIEGWRNHSKNVQFLPHFCQIFCLWRKVTSNPRIHQLSLMKKIVRIFNNLLYVYISNSSLMGRSGQSLSLNFNPNMKAEKLIVLQQWNRKTDWLKSLFNRLTNHWPIHTYSINTWLQSSDIS